MAVQVYQDILTMAQQLPLTAQVELAEALLRTIRTTLPQASSSSDQLLPLWSLSTEELRALADALVAPERQQKIRGGLQKQRSGSITKAELQELDTLLKEADQVALLKARALYTLKLRQSTLTAMAA